MKINENLKSYLYYVAIVWILLLFVFFLGYLLWNLPDDNSISYRDYYPKYMSYYEQEIANYKKGIKNGNVAPFGGGFLQVKFEGTSYDKNIDVGKTGLIEHVEVLLYKEGYFKNKNTTETFYILEGGHSIWVMKVYNDNWGIIGCKEESCDFTSTSEEFIEPFTYGRPNIYNE